MPNDIPNTTDSHRQLDAFLDRARELHGEISDAQSQLKEEYAAMKANGFDIPVLRKLVKIALETPEQREKRLEHEAILDTYKTSMNME